MVVVRGSILYLDLVAMLREMLKEKGDQGRRDKPMIQRKKCVALKLTPDWTLLLSTNSIK